MRNSYKKNRETATIGDFISVPGNAIGITVSDLSPFGDTVQVSWLEPTNEQPKCMNQFEVHSTRTKYTDESEIEIPTYAVAPTLWEPPTSDESVVFWLA